MSHARRALALAHAALIYLAGICLAGICLAGCSTEVDGPAAPVAGSTTGERRDAAVRVAEQTAVTLTSLDHRDPEAGFDRLLAALTGPARQEWEQRRAEYLATITSDALTSEDAAVDASGVAALDPAATTATVLVTATATVSTKQAPAAEQRQYRLRMSLIREEADWKVTQLQFVS